MKHSGEFLTYIPDSPYGSRIDSVFAYSRGIIAAGENGSIWAYESSANELAPYKLQQPMISSEDRDTSIMEYFDPDYLNIVSLALS